MKTRILVGTAEGLWSLDVGGQPSLEALAGRPVTALARDGHRTWALVEGGTLAVSEGDAGWSTRLSIDGPPATCLAPTGAGLMIGTSEAHLSCFDGERLAPVASFETVTDRAAWYTPWGDPADVRSIAAEPEEHGGAIYVNVHVGGVVRSRDGGKSWTPTVDIESDVHEVVAHPGRPGFVLAAAYEGLGLTRDGGDSWEFLTAGMHAHYCRAVAVAGDVVLVSASTGPGGKRAALYRRPLDGGADFARCRAGLPTWFGDNIDTGCLAAAGSTAVAGTEDGRLFRSGDAGENWALIAQGLPPIRSVLLG
jgi:photosystem II stability/assembly factor-like uncharacterized protein